jgi:hypothetical protein
LYDLLHFSPLFLAWLTFLFSFLFQSCFLACLSYFLAIAMSSKGSWRMITRHMEHLFSEEWRLTSSAEVSPCT